MAHKGENTATTAKLLPPRSFPETSEGAVATPANLQGVVNTLQDLHSGLQDLEGRLAGAMETLHGEPFGYGEPSPEQPSGHLPSLFHFAYASARSLTRLHAMVSALRETTSPGA